MVGQPVVTPWEPLRFWERLRAAAACAVSIWLFCSVGRLVLQPGDPQAALSLVAHENPWGAAVSAALLTGVAAMLATLIGPGRFDGFSCLAVGLGWMILNWGTGDMQQMLLYEAGAEASARSALYGRLAVETLFWGALAAECLAIEAAVRSWLGARLKGAAGASGAKGTEGFGSAGVSRGLLVGMMAAVVAAVFISQVAARSPVDDIYKGQVYFAVGVGFFLGALVGLYFCPRVSPLYFVAGICLVAGLSYLWAAIEPMPDLKMEAYRGLPGLPPTVLARPLPVEYVGLGMIGMLMGGWSARKMYVPAASERRDD